MGSFIRNTIIWHSECQNTMPTSVNTNYFKDAYIVKVICSINWIKSQGIEKRIGTMHNGSLKMYFDYKSIVKLRN